MSSEEKKVQIERYHVYLTNNEENVIVIQSDALNQDENVKSTVVIPEDLAEYVKAHRILKEDILYDTGVLEEREREFVDCVIEALCIK